MKNTLEMKMLYNVNNDIILIVPPCPDFADEKTETEQMALTGVKSRLTPQQ
jgi:hypothetical protein